jgi:hypothetical protein
MDEDLLSFLQHGTKEDIMTFLKWILDEYRCGKGVSFTNTGGSGGC